jgi:hypothetical protein
MLDSQFSFCIDPVTFLTRCNDDDGLTNKRQRLQREHALSRDELSPIGHHQLVLLPVQQKPRSILLCLEGFHATDSITDFHTAHAAWSHFYGWGR